MHVAAVIPAYNEASRLPAVLAAVSGVRQVDEIIVVNDGSSDETFQVAAEWPGVTAVHLPQNQGKAGALAAGVAQTRAEILLFLDADLIGLSSGHVEALLQPLFKDEADMSVGRFYQARKVTDWSHLLAPNISGQRALRRYLFEKIPQVDTLRFGIEMALNHQARRSQARVCWIEWPGVTHRTKEEKRGWVWGLGSRLGMYAEMFRYALRSRYSDHGGPFRFLKKKLIDPHSSLREDSPGENKDGSNQIYLPRWPFSKKTKKKEEWKPGRGKTY